MKIDRFLTAKLALILVPVLLTFGTKGAIAQIIPASDGTGTVVNGTQQLNITGGTQAGGNLFHSFQQFGVNAGQTANFLSNPNTQNILGRVTGGNASLINGLLQVSGSNANLYLINPSGIVFGQNASLNVPAAFTATTANGIGFGNGQWFNAVGSNNYGALTGNPNSFGFVGLSGSLINAGNLSVKPGQSIALVGGTVVNTGTISAPGGNITIAAIPGEKMVRIGQDGTILSLDLPTSDKPLINASVATPLSLPALLTGGSIPSAMGVVVEDGVVKLTAGSAEVGGTLSADGVGNQNGGTVLAYADNRLNFTGTISAKGGEVGGNGGFVDTSGKGQIDIAPDAKVVTTATIGLTGTWLIDPTDLTVVASGGTDATVADANANPGVSTINNSTIVSALNLTNVALVASNSITVDAPIDASGNANGRNLTLNAPTANLNQAIKLKAGSTLSGTATTVNVGATGTVQNGVDVAAANGTVKLAAATYTLAQTVNINKNLTVKGAGQTNTIVSGNEQVGVFKTDNGTTVTFSDLKITKGKNDNSGGGGGIEGNSALTLINSTISDNKAGFNGGGIYNNGTVSLTNSTISGNSTSGNNGGIFGSGAITLTDSTVSGNTAGDNAGGIYGGDTVTLTNSTVSNNTASNAGGGIFGNGGAVTLTNSTVSGNTAINGGGIFGVGTVTLTNSTISGNTAGSDGGGIWGSAVTLTNSTVAGNTARYGGGILSSAVTLTNSTVAGNTAGVDGSGIYSRGAVSLTNSTVAGNTATSGSGGGIYGVGTVSLTNSTVSGNTAQSGGGIYGYGGVSLTNSTVSSNTAQSGGGGGIFGYGGTIKNSIVAGNITTNGGQASDLAGSGFTNGGNNLIGANNGFAVAFPTSSLIGTIANPVDAKLAPLGNYGGPTQTHALLPGSPAINAAGPGSPTLDQRGNARFGIADIGAFESQGFTFSATAGTPQNIVVGKTSTTRLTVKVIANNPIEPVKGGVVKFTAPTSTATATLSAPTATIDASGNASVTATANTRIGAYTVKANIVGITPTADFNLTNLADLPNSIATTSGSGQTATVDQNFANNLVATVTDKFGNPVQGSTVTFSLLTTTSANGVFGSNTAVTDAAGEVSIGIKANKKPGSFTTTGKVGTVTTGADFKLTNIADVASLIVATSGSGQTTTVDQNFANNLVATVTDKFGNPIAGSTVTFSVPGSGASGTLGSNTPLTTNAAGEVSISIKANTKSGNFAATGKIGTMTTGANFTLTNTSDVPNSIVTTSGSGQTAVVDQTFASNLIATVTDQFGNPVQGSTVTFSLPGTGPSGVFGSNTAVTDANGTASIAIKANTKAGSFTTTGKVGGVTTGADFNLTNTADIANAIVANSGSGQTTTVDQNFANNLVATVTDKFGNPIVGSTVTFSVPGSGASGVFGSNSAVTDGTGKVSIGIKANTKSGAFRTTGKVDGVTTGADFNLTNTADVANSIVTTGGSNQLLIISQRSTQALQTQILDRFGNPVPNTRVTFILPIGGASGSFANGSNRMTTTTNADGIAILNFIANSVSGTYNAIAQIELPTGLKTTQFTLTNSIKIPYLELKKSPKSAPTIVPTKPILCVVRQGGSSVSDAYKGLPSCGSSSTQGKSIAPQSRRSDR